MASEQKDSPSVALVLTGGGARGAYQAGAIQGIAHILKEANLSNPIRIISGLSAGSINGAFVASGLHEFYGSAELLATTWKGLRTRDIYRSDAFSIGKIGFKLLTDVTSGSFNSHKLARALLDTRPLAKLLKERIPFDRIQTNIDKDILHGITVSTFSYAYQRSAIFYQARTPAVKRLRPRRKMREAKLDHRHVMASAAIPLLFPPIEIDGLYYGDGALRATAPFSPPIRLGADKMLIVGVRNPSAIAHRDKPHSVEKPSIGAILGMMLNSVFFDSADADIEKLSSINETLDEFASCGVETPTRYRPLDLLWLRPSQDVGEIGEQSAKKGMPRST
ncbi:MAG: patatin-like phospholipase family protein, partial [Bdellovibrionales bacterium]|nr:patatin-like phospholipase family protein [Bdellovibrionales bacterium]